MPAGSHVCYAPAQAEKSPLFQNALRDDRPITILGARFAAQKRTRGITLDLEQNAQGRNNEAKAMPLKQAGQSRLQVSSPIDLEPIL